MKAKKIRPEDVAKMLGVSPQTIRVGVQQGLYPFGVASKTKPTNRNHNYLFYPEKIIEYMGERKEGGEG